MAAARTPDHLNFRFESIDFDEIFVAITKLAMNYIWSAIPSGKNTFVNAYQEVLPRHFHFLQSVEFELHQVMTEGLQLLRPWSGIQNDFELIPPIAEAIHKLSKVGLAFDEVSFKCGFVLQMIGIHALCESLQVHFRRLGESSMVLGISRNLLHIHLARKLQRCLKSNLDVQVCTWTPSLSKATINL